MAHPTLTILYPATPAQPSDPSAPPHLQHPLHQQQTAHPLTGAEACDASPQPMNAAAAEIVQSEGAIAETVEAQRQSQQSLGTSAQAASFLPSPAATSAAAHEAEAAEAEADKAAEGGAASAEGFEAEGGKAAAAVGGGSSSGGWVEEAPHCDGPRGLQPRAAARGLAGPTLHILVEGYVSVSHVMHVRNKTLFLLVLNLFWISPCHLHKR